MKNILKLQIYPMIVLNNCKMNLVSINIIFSPLHPLTYFLYNLKTFINLINDILCFSTDMHVSGVDVAKPCISFAHFGFDEALLDVIIKHGYSEPTGIQKQVFCLFLYMFKMFFLT